MYHALDLGISVSDFWRMSPRAIYALQRELAHTIDKAKGSKGDGANKPRRLSYIPR